MKIHKLFILYACGQAALANPTTKTMTKADDALAKKASLSDLLKQATPLQKFVLMGTAGVGAVSSGVLIKRILARMNEKVIQKGAARMSEELPEENVDSLKKGLPEKKIKVSKETLSNEGVGKELRERVINKSTDNIQKTGPTRRNSFGGLPSSNGILESGMSPKRHSISYNIEHKLSKKTDQLDDVLKDVNKGGQSDEALKGVIDYLQGLYTKVIINKADDLAKQII